jgi:hypothetical protein
MIIELLSNIIIYILLCGERTSEFPDHNELFNKQMTFQVFLW